MNEEWQHPDRLADRFRGVLCDLDRCSPLNADVARTAAETIREVLRVYRFLDELFGATALAHLTRIAELEAQIAAMRAAGDNLNELACHQDDCEIVKHGVWSDPIPCTCGYTEAWKAWQEARGDD